MVEWRVRRFSSALLACCLLRCRAGHAVEVYNPKAELGYIGHTVEQANKLHFSRYTSRLYTIHATCAIDSRSLTPHTSSRDTSNPQLAQFRARKCTTFPMGFHKTFTTCTLLCGRSRDPYGSRVMNVHVAGSERYTRSQRIAHRTSNAYPRAQGRSCMDFACQTVRSCPHPINDRLHRCH